MRGRLVASGAIVLAAVFVFFLASSAISIDRSKLLLSLVQTITWPVLVLIIILTFRDTIRGLLSGADKLTFKAGATGVEATVERQQIEAAALLGAATGKQNANVFVEFLPSPYLKRQERQQPIQLRD